MALNAGTVWEVRLTGSNNNGGGWYNTGGASADYSQQNVAELTLADVVANGTTTLTSATGGLTDAMVGSLINVATKGRFQITARTDTNTITVDAGVAADIGLSAYVGGAVADPEQIDSLVVPGNDVHIEAGTYNAGGAVGFTAIGTTILGIRILGYKDSRNDNPRGDNRPLLAMGANALYHRFYTRFENFRITTTNASGLDLDAADYSVCRNVRVEQQGAVGAPNCIRLDIGSIVEDCEFLDAGNGADTVAVYAVNSNMTITRCHIHDVNIGMVMTGNGISVMKCIVSDCADYGIGITGNANKIEKNTIDGSGAEAMAFTGNANKVMNNQITHNVDGITWGDVRTSNLIDGNNYHGNSGNDVVNCEKGPLATANDPGYTNADAEDFSGVDTPDAIPMRLGVGL